MKLMAVLSMALAISLAAPCLATQDLSGVAPGDRVRVTLLSRDSEPQSVLFARSTPESLSVKRAGSASQTWLWSEVRGLERYEGRRGHAGIGAVIGALTGLVVGSLVGAAAKEESHFIEITTGGAVLIAALTTIAGTGLGALVGTPVRTERWSRVDLPGSE